MYFFGGTDPDRRRPLLARRCFQGYSLPIEPSFFARCVRKRDVILRFFFPVFPLAIVARR